MDFSLKIYVYYRLFVHVCEHILAIVTKFWGNVILYSH